MSLRDLDIDIDLDVNGGELDRVNQQIDNLIARIRTIGDIDIDADFNGNEALVEVEELQSHLNSLRDERVEIDVETDFNRTIVEMASLEERINSLDREDIFIDVDLRGSTSEILRMRQQLRVLEMQASHINVDIDTAGAHAQLALLQAHINGIRGPDINSGGGFLTNVLSSITGSLNPVGIAVTGATILGLSIAIAALLPTIVAIGNAAIGVVGALGVAIGVVGGAALGLVSAIGVAGIGVMGFGSIAMSSIMGLYEENAKLSASQLRLKAETDKVVDSWGDLKSAIEPFLFYDITSGVKAVNKILAEGEPILKNASLGVGELFDNMNKSIKGDDMQNFFGYMERAVAPLTVNIGNGLGNALLGVLNTMTALEPLTSWVSQGFENMMGSFADWTSGLKGSDAMKSFIDYTKENLPKIGGALGDMTLGVVDFFKAFAGISGDGFDWFGDKMEQFRDWASDLDDNEGFQNFLTNIKEAAPLIGDLITQITTTITGLWTALSEEPGENSTLVLLIDTFEKLSDFVNDPTIQKILNGSFSLDFGKTSTGINEWLNENYQLDAKIQDIKDKFSDIKINTADWFTDAWTGISDFYSDTKMNVTDWFSDTKVNITDWFGDTKLNITDFFSKTKVNITDWFSKTKLNITDFFARTKVNITDWFSKTKINITDFFSRTKVNITDWFSKTKMNVTDWFSKTKLNISQFFSDAKINIAEWFTGKLNIGASFTSFNWSDFISKFTWPKVGNFSWSSFISKFSWPKASTFSWSNFISKFNWPKISSFNWSTFVSKFNWPKLPSFSWSSFISKFSWPSIPSINWSSFIPKFNWPKVSMPKLSIPGFSSGLGRVPGDMNATIHKDEAIIQASEAQKLRDTGILSGDGRYPTINTNAVSTTSVSTSSVAPSSVSNSSGGNNYSMPISITVQGGNTNNETGNAVASAIESMFANMRDVFPAMREG